MLVTGPTGSGKTTTLYAALDKINVPEKKIITIEDPVEYQLKGVNQIAVRPKIGLTFASGLRSIVRQDPDVIMVGEIRDLETAEISIHAALTGHLVFSTLHTNDAPGSITRLQDMGVEPYLLASVLSGVLAQRLVRRICQSCRVRHEPDPADLLAIGVSDAGGAELYRGEGCEACRKTGYKGRVGIYELFLISEEIRSLILRKASTSEIRRHAMELRHGLAPRGRLGQGAGGSDHGRGDPARHSGRLTPACRPSHTGPRTGRGRPSTASWRRPTRAASSSACSGTPTSPSTSSRRTSAGPHSG